MPLLQILMGILIFPVGKDKRLNNCVYLCLFLLSVLLLKTLELRFLMSSAEFPSRVWIFWVAQVWRIGKASFPEGGEVMVSPWG